MRKKLITGTVSAMLLGMSAPGLAADKPSWDYLSLEWVLGGDLEVDGFKEGIDGYRLDAAKGLGDFFFVRASSNSYHFDLLDNSIDITAQQLSAGGHFPLPAGLSTIDLWGSVNYERVNFLGVVGTGPGVDVGVRAMLTPGFELGISGKVHGDLDFGNGVDADYTGYTLGAAFTAMPGIDILGSFSNYELDDGVDKFEYKDVFGLGVRFTF